MGGMGGRVYRNNYKGLMDKTKGGRGGIRGGRWRWLGWGGSVRGKFRQLYLNNNKFFKKISYLYLFLLFNILFYFLNFCIVVQLQLSPFPAITLPCPTHPLPSTFSPLPPVVFVHGSFIHFPWPVPFFPHHPPSSSLLVTVSLFFISMSVVMFCSFVCFVD